MPRLCGAGVSALALLLPLLLLLFLCTKYMAHKLFQARRCAHVGPCSSHSQSPEPEPESRPCRVILIVIPSPSSSSQLLLLCCCSCCGTQRGRKSKRNRVVACNSPACCGFLFFSAAGKEYFLFNSFGALVSCLLHAAPVFVVALVVVVVGCDSHIPN